jgi:PhzF family phenazine biosynthesis protein
MEGSVNVADIGPELWVVDVFASRPLSGNPAAVVFGGGDLSADTMQAIAREANLSETVFVFAATSSAADYGARIFTTRREIDFAGHPTLAAAHAVACHDGTLASAKKTRIVQECRIGLVAIELRANPPPARFLVRLPAATRSETGLRATELAPMLGLTVDRFAQTRFPVVATGVPWLLVQVRSVEDLARLDVDHMRVARITRSVGAVGLSVFARHAGPGVVARLRSFAPAEGIYEDPVCGSCHGATVAYLLAEGDCARPPPGGRISFFMQQGHELSRPGLVEVMAEARGDDCVLFLGGDCITVLKGRLSI